MNTKSISLSQTTLLVAVIGLFGSFIATYAQGCNSIKQQRLEFESQLITNAIKSGDDSTQRRNLKFLLDAGLIIATENNLNNILNNPKYIIPEGPLATNVFLCTMTDSHAFHTDKNCRALNNCTDSIISVPRNVAILRYLRKECKFCNTY